MSYKVNIVVEQDSNGFYAFCPELEGCHSQGNSEEEVMTNIREAIELYLETIPENERFPKLGKSVHTTLMEVEIG